MGTLSHGYVDIEQIKLNEVIYLDNNATTMLDEQVIQSMIEHLQKNSSFGNPSSKHCLGENARQLIEQSRSIVRQSINGRTEDKIIFTSGGTESNHLAIRGILSLNLNSNSNEIEHIITSPFEHPSVDKYLRLLESQYENVHLSFVRVDHQGLIDLNHFQQLLRPETKLVTLMHSNNEIGTIQPIEDVVKICRNYSRSIRIHSDASQSMGKTFIDVQQLDVDLLTICSHKYHGPKGIAALYLRSDLQLQHLLFNGGNQEMGYRSGTENLLGIVGLAKASELICQRSILNQRIEKMKQTRDKLYQGLIKRWNKDFSCQSQFQSKPIRNGHEDKCLVNTLSLSYPNLNGKLLVEQLKCQVAFSTGSACHEDSNLSSSHFSSTLTSIGLTNEFIIGTIRLSTCSTTTDEDIQRAITIISDGIQQQLNNNGFL